MNVCRQGMKMYLFNHVMNTIMLLPQKSGAVKAITSSLTMVLEIYLLDFNYSQQAREFKPLSITIKHTHSAITYSKENSEGT